MHRACDSVTLQWLKSSGEHVRYCLYRRRESVNYLEELVSQHTDLCLGSLPEEQLVGCYDHDGTVATGGKAPLSGGLEVRRGLFDDPDLDPGDEVLDGIIETTVSDLESGTTYRFDLLARPLHRPHSQDLPYRTVWVKTRAFC